MFDDLIKKLKKKGLMTFAYADDLAITGHEEKYLKQAITICQEWAIENNM